FRVGELVRGLVRGWGLGQRTTRQPSYCSDQHRHSHTSHCTYQFHLVSAFSLPFMNPGSSPLSIRSRATALLLFDRALPVSASRCRTIVLTTFGGRILCAGIHPCHALPVPSVRMGYPA